jgi:peptide/nickel transport system permease protein
MRQRWNPDLKVGLAIVVLIGALSLISLVYTPYDQYEMDATAHFLVPGPSHMMGTDDFGRDVFSRVMVGGRYTLLVALGTVLGSATVGTILGLVVGYVGGIVGDVTMRAIDALSAFPGILLALVMVTVLPSGPFTIVAALLILFIPTFTRIMRGGMLQYKDRDFVKTARVFGAGHLRVIFVHILPNLFPVLLSAIVIGLSNAILAEVALSYLGLGIQPPLPSWGRMLAESQNYLFNAVWCALAPGCMITLTVVGFHYLGEGIRKRYC